MRAEKGQRDSRVAEESADNQAKCSKVPAAGAREGMGPVGGCSDPLPFTVLGSWLSLKPS